MMATKVAVGWRTMSSRDLAASGGQVSVTWIWHERYLLVRLSAGLPFEDVQLPPTGANS
jgi:hypothetical protein